MPSLNPRNGAPPPPNEKLDTSLGRLYVDGITDFVIRSVWDVIRDIVSAELEKVGPELPLSSVRAL